MGPSRKLLTIFGMLLITVLAGCTTRTQSSRDAQRPERQPDEQVRDAVAKATERLKPEVEWLARNFGYALKRGAELAIAAIEGVWQGWHSSGSQNQSVDLNSASEYELMRLPGITPNDARRIVHGRPYRDKRELVTKGILSEADYAKIRDYTTLK